MAGEAPNFLPDEGRLARWLTSVTDGRLTFYMLVLAAAVASALLLIDASVFHY